MQVADRPSPDAPSLTQAIIVQMVCLWKETKKSAGKRRTCRKCPWGSMTFHTVDPRKKAACACLATDVNQVTFTSFSCREECLVKDEAVVIIGLLSRYVVSIRAFFLFFCNTEFPKLYQCISFLTKFQTARTVSRSHFRIQNELLAKQQNVQRRGISEVRKRNFWHKPRYISNWNFRVSQTWLFSSFLLSSPEYLAENFFCKFSTRILRKMSHWITAYSLWHSDLKHAEAGTEFFCRLSTSTLNLQNRLHLNNVGRAH